MLRVRVPRIAPTNYTLVADGGVYTYLGNNANLLYSRKLQANGGVYTYLGNNANLTYSGASNCPTAEQIAQAVWSYILEGSVSSGEMLRGVTRTQLAKVDINETTGQVTIYKLDGTTVFAQASTSPTGDRNAPTVDWTP